jgi:hypothetical protein
MTLERSAQLYGHAEARVVVTAGGDQREVASGQGEEIGDFFRVGFVRIGGFVAVLVG